MRAILFPFVALAALAVTGARADDVAPEAGDPPSYEAVGMPVVIEDDLTGGVGATAADPGNVVVIQMQPQAAAATTSSPVSFRFVGPSR